jgi:hypothetical protein
MDAGLQILNNHEAKQEGGKDSHVACWSPAKMSHHPLCETYSYLIEIYSEK